MDMETQTTTMKTQKNKIVACIPASNEENSIGPVVLKTLEYVDKVIECDDGSDDLTGQVATMMGAIVITHERNMGYGAAIRSLLRARKKLVTLLNKFEFTSAKNYITKKY